MKAQLRVSGSMKLAVLVLAVMLFRATAAHATAPSYSGGRQGTTGPSSSSCYRPPRIPTPPGPPLKPESFRTGASGSTPNRCRPISA